MTATAVTARAGGLPLGAARSVESAARRWFPRRDLLLLWGVLGAFAVAIFATYTRTPANELYQVRHGGPGEGLKRALAFAGFPAGPIALATLPLVLQGLRRRALVLGTAAGALVATGVLWPGALDEAGVDAAPARFLTALGVAVVIGLTLRGARVPAPAGPRRQPWDRARVAVGGILLFAALPWIGAEMAVSLDRVPLLNGVFLTDVLASQPGVPGLHPAVHDGHHHGMSGILLALAALVLSRMLPLVRATVLRHVTGLYLSFLFVYGCANALQDLWLEQVVKRGLTTAQLPMMLAPSLRPAWAVIVGASILLFLAASSLVRRRGRSVPVPVLP